MGKGRKGKGSGSKSSKHHFRSSKDKKNPQEKGWDERDNSGSYPSIVKENAAFEKFYRAQKIVSSEEEWAQFMETVRQPLPSDFRISSHCIGQAEVMRQQIMNLSKLAAPNAAGDHQEEVKKNGDKTEEGKTGEKSEFVVSSMPWYPNQLAWSINLSKTEIRKTAALNKLHHFLISETETGDISRQEAVSMIPPLLLQVQPGHSVLDMCAAPGSKTAQIIEMLHADASLDFVLDADGVPVRAKDSSSGGAKALNGLVVANDLDNKRCYMLVHQSNRLHSPCVVITNHDASAMPTFYKPSSEGKSKSLLKFDRVLADVPCTGDGTLRKNYDVWSKWNAANSNNFHCMQAKIARRGLELLAKGGLMAYSTCSLNPSEDESVVASLLNAAGADALELVDAAATTLPALKHLPGLEHWTVWSRDGLEFASYAEVPENLRMQIRESHFPPANAAELRLRRCIRILPHYQNTGGFFIAILRKKVDRMPWEPAEEEKKEEKKESNEEGGEGGTDKTSLNVGRGGKKRQFFGYKEDPFFFLTKEDPDWTDIKSFFNLPEHFNARQLAHRCAVGKRRNLYFLTELAADFVALNDHVKIISGGCRLFVRVDVAQVPCAFRVTQEGISSLFPYFVRNLDKYEPVVAEEGNEEELKRTFSITELDTETFLQLLRQEDLKMEQLPGPVRAKLQAVTHGSAILYTRIARPPPNSASAFLVALCAWKGRASVRAYVARNEKLHLMRLCGVEEPKLEEKTTATDDKGQAVKKTEEEEEKEKAENGNGNNQEEEDESAPPKKCKLDEQQAEVVENNKVD